MSALENLLQRRYGSHVGRVNRKLHIRADKPWDTPVSVNFADAILLLVAAKLDWICASPPVKSYRAYYSSCSDNKLVSTYDITNENSNSGKISCFWRNRFIGTAKTFFVAKMLCEKHSRITPVYHPLEHI